MKGFDQMKINSHITITKKYAAYLLIAVMLILTISHTARANANSQPSQNLKLTKVVVLSRHNIRSPLSDNNSVLGKITPHKWFNWTSRPSELSLRGAVLEVIMGQYFRLWLESEGLFPENYIPEEGAVRFYANAFQRTQATANYFSAGLLPVTRMQVERHVEYNQDDDTFLPKCFFFNDQYAKALHAEISKNAGNKGLSSYQEKLKGTYELLIKILDVKKSKAFINGQIGDLLNDEITLKLEANKEPSLSGSLRLAVSIADALILQFYEEQDDLKAAFGHKLTEDDWKRIGNILGTYESLLCSSPLFAINGAHPMLKEIYSELTQKERKFSYLCGHDSTIEAFLAALNVKDYILPNAIEPKTPIGVKVVFERWEDASNASDIKNVAFYKINIVYQSVDQLRKTQPLSLKNPPMIVPIFFTELKTNEQGMVKEEELLMLLKSKIDAFYELEKIFDEDEKKNREDTLKEAA